MAFGGFTQGQGQQPVAEINMIPLIDVMLVLLVIFIVTAPLLTHAVKIDLPKASSQVNVVKRENIHLSIDAAGTVYWNGEAVTAEAWRARMTESARLQPQPELHIRADGEIAYRQVVGVMSDAARAGITRIGFVTDPRVGP
jgi:biopolymer transport protein ExbD